MRQLSASKKLAAIREVINSKKSLSSVSKEYKCSRQSLHTWLNRYKDFPQKGKNVLEGKYRRGSAHYKKLPWKVERVVLDFVVKNPSLSLRRLTREVNNSGYKVSLKGVYGILARHNLQTAGLRHNFSILHPVRTLFSHEFSPAYRAKIVEEHLEESKPVSELCRRWKISRPTFYKWLKRYRATIDNLQLTTDEKGIVSDANGQTSVVEALVRRHKRGLDHYKSVSGEAQKVVLKLASEKPEFSVHKLYAEVPRVEGKPIVGHHGIQNILKRNNLSSYSQRLEYAQGQQLPEQLPIPAEAPALPRGILIRILSPFATIPKFVISTPITWPVAIPFLLFVAYILEIDKAFRPTIFFPITALTFGLLFFAYSAKYYASLVFVLRQGARQDRDEGVKNSDQRKVDNGQTTENQSANSASTSFATSIFKKIFKSKKNFSVGLVEDLSKVELKSLPFVSVHIPIYNEKRVVERMIKACTSLKWEVRSGKLDKEVGSANYDSSTSSESSAAKAAYEVVIVDDSTDETTEIAKKVMSEAGRQLVLERVDEKLQIYSSIPPEGSGQPVIKLIHRSTRAGFKGAALREALRSSDKRAEYILVFDADFIPYPDTIEQFVRYFALVDASDTGSSNADPVSEKSEKEPNRVAAVQGYQWHVLNKSENWITRGVRSEYAGSYVVERSAIELYGGLKMIAGSVYAIRRNVLEKFGWGTSITEDFELTLRLYAEGYRVVYTPYIQAPAEAVATVRRLIRQRMRWAEGHSFNIKKHFFDIVRSPHLTFSEKFEFAYLAPYYLQAAFFVVGTLAWFLAEVVFKVNLPFWTAALGWSLVFSNFLALPLVNLLGLFLEQSEEKDYLGVFSFIILSYLVTPFQAYAAVRGYFEKEEGPWFRTPKTGHVTDVFGRFKIWQFKLGFPFGRPAVAKQVSGFSSQVSGVLAPVSSFNPLQGYDIKPRRISLASRSVIAAFLVIVMLINYLAFFAEPKLAKAAGTPKIEQQINILTYNTSNDGYTTTSTTDNPTDNSLGLIRWDASVFSDISAVYFEAVIKTSNASHTTTASLYDKDGNQISGSGCTVTTTSTTYTRVRASTAFTACTNYATPDDYTVRIKISDGASTASIKAARLIVLQVGAADGMITKTQTQAELSCGECKTTQTAYTIVANPKYYCFDVTQTGTTCSTAASPSRFSPSPTVYFEAAMKIANAASTHSVALFTTGGTQVTSSEVTTTSTSYTRVRSSAITLTAGTEYEVRHKTSNASHEAAIIGGKLIIEQSDATNGIAAVETLQSYTTGYRSTTGSYANLGYPNSFDTSNISGTITYYHEAAIYVEDGKDTPAGTTKSRISDGTQNLGEVTSTSTTRDRIRSTSISPTTAVFDSQLECTSCSSRTAVTTQNWLIIQLQSIPVPEIAILALPMMLFLPKLIRYIKEKRKSKKKKAAGGRGQQKRFWSSWIVDKQIRLAI